MTAGPGGELELHGKIAREDKKTAVAPQRVKEFKLQGIKRVGACADHTGVYVEVLTRNGGVPLRRMPRQVPVPSDKPPRTRSRVKGLLIV